MKYQLTIATMNSDRGVQDEFDSIQGDTLDELAAKAILLFTQLANRNMPRTKHYSTCPMYPDHLVCTCNDDDIPF
jgi:hypothetical protein